MLNLLYCIMDLKIVLLKLLSYLPRANKLMYLIIFILHLWYLNVFIPWLQHNEPWILNDKTLLFLHGIHLDNTMHANISDATPLTHYPPGRSERNFRWLILVTDCRGISFVELLSDECHVNLMIISQHGEDIFFPIQFGILSWDTYKLTP